MVAWTLLTAPGLPDAMGSNEQGLLVAALDILSKAITVVGVVPMVAGADCRSAAESISVLLPQGLYVVGSYSSGSISSISSWKPAAAAKGTFPVVAAANTAAAAGGGVQWTLNGQPATRVLAAATQTAAEPPEDDVRLSTLVPGFVPFRCHLDVKLQLFHPAPVSASSSSDSNNKNGTCSGSNNLPTADAVRAAFAELSSRLLSQQLVLITEQDGSDKQPAPTVIISPHSSSSSSKVTVEEVLKLTSGSSNPCRSLLPLQHTTCSSSSSSSSKASAPMFEFDPAQPATSRSNSNNNSNSGNNSPQQQQLSHVVLTLDVLCFAPSTLPLSEVLQQLLQPAVQQQLDTMQQQVLMQLEPAAAAAAAQGPGQQQQQRPGQLVPAVQALHFLPPGLAFPVTVCYPQVHSNAETRELKLMPVRQQLHQLLALPDNVPMLRAANALTWVVGAAAAAGESAGPARPVRLRNVHEGLAPPGFGGQVYLVDGAYEYYHYMQDKFNDNGWGCAYRSLQTLISWFRLQKYTSKPVPGHRQIQEILVKLGDKESSFVGSSKWIGAIELSYVLDDYLGITSKVLTVNRGSDIPGQARALAQHFVSQGTPVMIGGGVLAYTLLGVAFNEDTGEAAFLILDPHYTGGEDLKKITQGTWVAWKQPGDNAAAGGSLFVQDAFYNFLCPQRPRTV